MFSQASKGGTDAKLIYRGLLTATRKRGQHLYLNHSLHLAKHPPLFNNQPFSEPEELNSDLCTHVHHVEPKQLLQHLGGP